MRIHVVAHAQKPQNCGKCGGKIKPSRLVNQRVKGKVRKVRVLGDGYKWIKFRHGGKRTRCMNTACNFTRADLTTSDKLSRIYAAQDSAQFQIGAWGGEEIEDLKAILQGLADEVREVAEEYRDSADNIRGTFAESPTADDCEQKADDLDGWVQSLEVPEFEEFDPNGDSGTREVWVESQRTTAEDLINNCPV